jgi:DNA transposition AAA+ family ATPase
MPGKYPTDATMIAELNEFIREQKLTYKTLCKMLLIEGVNETYISKYIGDKLDRQVENFEGRARDMLKGLRQRIAFGTEIFESSVTRRIANAFDLIRRTGQIGLVTGRAGHGKSSGKRRYLLDNPSALEITLTAGGGSAARIQSMIFAKIDTQSWDGCSSRFQYLVERFQGASRLLIIDNFQRLDSSGRNWVFDFHDAANCPIGGIGNPEALKPIMANDQHASRMGIVTKYELETAELSVLAHQVARQFSDETTADTIQDLCAIIAAEDGALRSVELTVVLMQELRKASASLCENPRAALRSAHSRLNRNYLLPED